VKLNLIIIDI